MTGARPQLSKLGQIALLDRRLGLLLHAEELSIEGFVRIGQAGLALERGCELLDVVVVGGIHAEGDEGILELRAEGACRRGRSAGRRRHLELGLDGHARPRRRALHAANDPAL